jgi:hypothetical protein
MAREHARLWLDINSDDDFEALPFEAQGFYTRVVLTLADLSYCGVARWLPKKLTTKAPDLTYARIMAAAQALETGRYCLFDLDTEEVLVRSFIRRDQLLRNPKYAAAVLRTYNDVASKSLRAAVVTEVRRAHEEHPEYSSWTAKDKTTDIGAELSKLMAKPGLDRVPYTNRITVPITNGQTVRIGNPDSVRIGNPDSVRNGNPVGNADSVPIPLTLTLTPTPSPLEGLPNRGTSPGPPTPNPNGPRPSDRCLRHIHTAAPPPCGDCADARRTAESWDADQLQAAKAQQQAFLAEIDACAACDEHGWVLDDHPDADEPALTRCPQHNWAHRQAAAHA